MDSSMSCDPLRLRPVAASGLTRPNLPRRCCEGLPINPVVGELLNVLFNTGLPERPASELNCGLPDKPVVLFGESVHLPLGDSVDLSGTSKAELDCRC